MHAIAVHNLFEYDPETGIFTHRVDHGQAKAGNVVGWKDCTGYTRTKFRGKTYGLHTLAWLYVYGEMPKEIDHINGIRDDNRIVNLRLATRTNNCCNAAHPTGKSGYRGVEWHDGMRKWRSRINIRRKAIILGYYDTPEEAAAIYNKAQLELHGEFAYQHREKGN